MLELIKKTIIKKPCNSRIFRSFSPKYFSFNTLACEEFILRTKIRIIIFNLIQTAVNFRRTCFWQSDVVKEVVFDFKFDCCGNSLNELFRTVRFHFWLQNLRLARNLINIILSHTIRIKYIENLFNLPTLTSLSLTSVLSWHKIVALRSLVSVILSKIAINLSMVKVRGPSIFCLISGPLAFARFRILPAFFKKKRLSVLGGL